MGTPANPPPATAAGWQACSAITTDTTARLACFDTWARSQAGGPPVQAAAVPPASAALAATAPPAVVTPPPQLTVQVDSDCHAGQYSNLSRFWELEGGTDCGAFGIRGYRPMSLSVVVSDGVNTFPTSTAPGHNATAVTPYRTTENRINISVRTKVAQGLLTQGDDRKDSLWFGYTQQSYWQLFSGGLSRPFRTTDHEPEVMYVYPADFNLPGGWRMRYAGAGAVHQSNGQPLPLSRSWNRVYLMAGMEKDKEFTVTGRVWHRLNESPGSDDNPEISNFIGRGEISGYWNFNKDNTLGVTVRHSLGSKARGSARLEWLKTLGDKPDAARPSGLRLHTQLFSGYGDSLIDYNRKRTVLSVGLSLVDF
ncbi:MAG: phospholipase [Comamonadaceae bacterium]|nr:MAG: phospholipase [Comamonadaceae bacterium]